MSVASTVAKVKANTLHAHFSKAEEPPAKKRKTVRAPKKKSGVFRKLHGKDVELVMPLPAHDGVRTQEVMLGSGLPRELGNMVVEYAPVITADTLLLARRRTMNDTMEQMLTAVMMAMREVLVRRQKISMQVVLVVHPTDTLVHGVPARVVNMRHRSVVYVTHEVYENRFLHAQLAAALHAEGVGCTLVQKRIDADPVYTLCIPL